MLVFAADGQQNLSNSHSCTQALGLSKCSTHASLKPISSSTGKHLVDPQNMEGVHANPQMESVLASMLNHVLVGSNTCCLQSL